MQSESLNFSEHCKITLSSCFFTSQSLQNMQKSCSYLFISESISWLVIGQLSFSLFVHWLKLTRCISWSIVTSLFSTGLTLIFIWSHTAHFIMKYQEIYFYTIWRILSYVTEPLIPLIDFWWMMVKYISTYCMLILQFILFPEKRHYCRLGQSKIERLLRQHLLHLILVIVILVKNKTKSLRNI